jgi:hypothetical protein
VRWLYLRDDRHILMWRCQLREIRQGWLRQDGECYIRLADFEPCTWRHWAFAERFVEISSHSDQLVTAGQQEPLPGLTEALQCR